MAYFRNDPLEEMKADYRLAIRPNGHYGFPEIITINLEQLHSNLRDHLKLVFENDAVCYRYISEPDISTDVNSLCDFIIGVTYNRLRSILKMTCPTEFLNRMNNRCPVSKDLEFPTFVSTTLSAIGPCRIMNGPVDKLVVFAPTANTETNYGRAVPVVFNYCRYIKLITVLKDLKYQVAPLDFGCFQGGERFFPFTEFRPASNGTFTLYGTVHSSHYEIEDMVRIALCCSSAGISPFEKTGMTIGYVDDETVLDALDAVAPPQDIPEGQNATSPERPTGAHFRVNYLGIQPAVPATGEVPAKKRGVYIVGRGTIPYWQCSLARQVSPCELFQCIAFRLTRRDP